MSEYDTYPDDTTALPTDEPGQDTDSWRHPVNVAHLVMGLAFLGLVVVWGLIAGDVVADDDIRWLLPVPWVLAGGAGLVATALGARRRSQAS